jgi:pimeloyl-ACP methyl ester carboxylesterase
MADGMNFGCKSFIYSRLLIAEKIPKATLKIFKNTGHDAPRDIPNEFNKTALGFFNKQR